MTNSLDELKNKHPEWCWKCGHKLFECEALGCMSNPLVAVLLALAQQHEAELAKAQETIAELKVSLEKEERDCLSVIGDRDRYHEKADDLTEAIARHLGADFGEHSSSNSPWDKAIEALVDAEAAAQAELAKAQETIQQQARELEEAEVQEPIWIVNDSAELGVKVGGRFFFLYKGDNIEYEDAKHDDGTPMLWRIVGKREFGEVCHPLQLIIENIERHKPIPFPYTQELSWDPQLSFGTKESGEWRPLPARHSARSQQAEANKEMK